VLGIIGNGAYAPLSYFFVALAVAAFGVETWAFVDALIRPAQAYVAAGKRTKPIWLIITGVAFVLGLYAAAYGGVTNFLAVAAFVGAAVYLAAAARATVPTVPGKEKNPGYAERSRGTTGPFACSISFSGHDQQQPRLAFRARPAAAATP
jgi:hypothetical protein